MNRFHKIFTPNESLTSIMERDDVFAYEIENFPPNERPISVRVYNRLSKYCDFLLKSLFSLLHR